MPPLRANRRRLAWLPAAGLVALAACAGRTESKVAADREVYGALRARRAGVPEVVGSLDVDAADARAAPARQVKEVTLDLEGAVRLAADASRDYRAQRETVYLQALAYTTQRHAFENQYRLGGSVDAVRDESSGSVTGSPDASVSRNLESGGAIALKIASEFLSNLTGDPVATARTLLSSSLVLPMARGSGTLVAREPLTQAERTMLYALRSFARFQQEFLVDVASGFYRVLETRDTLANEETSYKSLALFYERAKAFGAAGRLPDFEVDQAKQDMLRADDRRVQAQRAYEGALDEYKKVLGLPVACRLTLTEASLDALRARGVVDPAVDLGTALSEALARRLDLVNARDQHADAQRHVEVAVNALGPQVDLRLGAVLTGPPRRPLDFDSAKAAGTAGLDVDLPTERTAERNEYRAAMILEQRARRAVEGTEDDVVAQVRRDFRVLEQARQSYAIQKEGVRLAGRRVESANLNLQAGKASIRDVLEAENALVSAKNDLTTALVDHAVARLELERDMGSIGAAILDTAAKAPAPEAGPASAGAPPSGLAPASPSAPPPPSPAVVAPPTPAPPVPPPAGPAVPAR